MDIPEGKRKWKKKNSGENKSFLPIEIKKEVRKTQASEEIKGN